ncbi:MAG TPA: hypothetical protein VE988_05835 [Gemmataceae bacterium]|nr:hypothetical protein [Gemmataceae bacterium]
MEPFARIVIGYHGCTEAFAHELLLGAKPLDQWQPSTNDWDWLGHGVYFWEHSPERAMRWAREKFTAQGDKPTVVGAVIQLGRCFDLLNEAMTEILAQSYQELSAPYEAAGKVLPQNRGRDWKIRELDCMVINDCMRRLASHGVVYDTVRGAFLEGAPAYPNAGFSREAHIQIAIRNPACVLGVFRPNWKL